MEISSNHGNYPLVGVDKKFISELYIYVKDPRTRYLFMKDFNFELSDRLKKGNACANLSLGEIRKSKYTI